MNEEGNFIDDTHVFKWLSVGVSARMCVRHFGGRTVVWVYVRKYNIVDV